MLESGWREGIPFYTVGGDMIGTATLEIPWKKATVRSAVPRDVYLEQSMVLKGHVQPSVHCSTVYSGQDMAAA